MARYVLSERAADWMRAQMNAGYVGAAAPARQRVRDDSLPLPLPVHFELTREVREGAAVWRVGEGAVQDGQNTVWFEGADVDLTSAGEEIVYASLSASESEGAGKSVTVGVVADASELAALQTDGGPTVWPLYHLTDGLIDMDYRPIFSVGGGSAPRAPLPYEVRKLSVAVTQGGSTTNVRRWCIYLPGDVLYIDRVAVDVTDNLTAAVGVSGWYELDSFSAGTVYLHITLPYDEEPSGSASEGASASASEVGETVHHDAEAEIVTTRSTPGDHDFYVTVARVASDGKVTQFVVGSIVLGSGSGGGSSASGAFAFSGGVIGVGAVTVGRQAYKVNEDGFDIEEDGEGDGDYRVRVELDAYGNEPTIEVQYGDGFEAPPSELVSYFPLYTIEGGRVTADFRGTFVLPVWELAQEASE